MTKVEIRKTCKVCNKKLTKRQRTFCGKKCRTKFYNIKYKDQHADLQRARAKKKRHEDPRPKIQCLICGEWFRQVGTHIVQAHKITAREYRKQFGFDVKKGQLPADYKKLKSDQAINCGGYKNLKIGKKFWFKKGDTKAGTYKRSNQTLTRLKVTKNKIQKKKQPNCIICNTKLTGNQTKYCSIKCRQKDYKIKYNKHKTKLFD